MKRTLVTLAAAGCTLAAMSAVSPAASAKPTAEKTPARAAATKTLTVERDVPYSQDKIWAALTQSPIIAKWLMKTDFQPVVGHKFKFTADWGSVDGQVLTVKPKKTLSYTWAAYGLTSVVTWTLTPTSKGTHVRMAQSGFPVSQPQYYDGAKGGWQKYFVGLEKVLAEKD